MPISVTPFKMTSIRITSFFPLFLSGLFIVVIKGTFWGSFCIFFRLVISFFGKTWYTYHFSALNVQFILINEEYCRHIHAKKHVTSIKSREIAHAYAFETEI